jgi:hypothetical protein
VRDELRHQRGQLRQAGGARDHVEVDVVAAQQRPQPRLDAGPIADPPEREDRASSRRRSRGPRDERLDHRRVAPPQLDVEDPHEVEALDGPRRDCRRRGVGGAGRGDPPAGRRHPRGQRRSRGQQHPQVADVHGGPPRT